MQPRESVRVDCIIGYWLGYPRPDRSNFFRSRVVLIDRNNQLTLERSHHPSPPKFQLQREDRDWTRIVDASAYDYIPGVLGKSIQKNAFVLFRSMFVLVLRELGRAEAAEGSTYAGTLAKRQMRLLKMNVTFFQGLFCHIRCWWIVQKKSSY